MGTKNTREQPQIIIKEDEEKSIKKEEKTILGVFPNLGEQKDFKAKK